jgi:hypothetical protein
VAGVPVPGSGALTGLPEGSSPDSAGFFFVSSETLRELTPLSFEEQPAMETAAAVVAASAVHRKKKRVVDM